MTAGPRNLTWRPLAVSDAAAMADLLNAVDAEDHVWGRYTVQDAADELGSPIADLPASTLAVLDGATMLGFSAVHHEPAAEAVHRMQVAGAVRPSHRRQRLGTALLRHGLETAPTLHARHHPTLPLLVETLYGEHVRGAVALYRAAGMTATQWSVQTQGSASPSAPASSPTTPRYATASSSDGPPAGPRGATEAVRSSPHQVLRRRPAGSRRRRHRSRGSQ